MITAANVQIETLDHHCLGAATCRDLKIAERINKRIDSEDSRRFVCCGEAVTALIINGLGFTNRRLYLTSQFFESTAVSQLLVKSWKLNILMMVH